MTNTPILVAMIHNDATSATVDSVVYLPNDKGIFEIPQDKADQLIPHGFRFPEVEGEAHPETEPAPSQIEPLAPRDNPDVVSPQEAHDAGQQQAPQLPADEPALSTAVPVEANSTTIVEVMGDGQALHDTGEPVAPNAASEISDPASPADVPVTEPAPAASPAAAEITAPADASAPTAPSVETAADVADANAAAAASPALDAVTTAPDSLAEKSDGIAPDTALVEIAGLNGSSIQPSTFDLADGTTLQLGVVIAKAFQSTGATVEEWNALDDATREGFIAEVVKGLPLKA